MPQRVWSYLCCGPGKCGPEPMCAEHRKKGTFAGWWPRSSEWTERYVRVHGLAHKGAHRDLADRVFAPLRDRCPACRGSGWLGEETDDAPLICPGCDGVGCNWICAMDEVAAARELVIRAFPEARTGWRMAG